MDGFLEFEPRMVMFRVNNRPIAEKFSRLTWEECGLCPIFAYYNLAFVLQMMEKTQKIPVQVVQKCQVGMIQCVDMVIFVFQRPEPITKGYAP